MPVCFIYLITSGESPKHFIAHAKTIVNHSLNFIPIAYPGTVTGVKGKQGYTKPSVLQKFNKNDPASMCYNCNYYVNNGSV